jgi:hypothetical protein
MRLISQFTFIAIFHIGCNAPKPVATGNTKHLYESDSFKNYWYAGRAEVNSYHLSQSRYGETREGKSILIFVTEDFSKNKQVKLDDPSTAGDDKVSVLKMNFTKNFVTGIYPYSLMLSVFTPVSRNQYPNSMKATMSSQEWCGHVFSQLNLNKDNYHFQSHSYFEKEGEENGQLKKTWLEDELWNLIRLDPANLPTGKVELIPGLFFSRLLHTGLHTENATLTKQETEAEVEYTIALLSQKRLLTIHFEKQFPHKIIRWEESFEERGKPVTTSAVLHKSIVSDYWTKNKNEFLYLRDSLGLSHRNY